MESDAEGLIGAGRHERSPDRVNYRDGYRERALDTRLGTLQLRVPKRRQSSLDPLRGSSPAVPRAEENEREGARGRDPGGVGRWRLHPARRRAGPGQAMGLPGIGKSTVSKLCKDIDERVNAFLDRPLQSGWPYLWLDATYPKVREGSRIISVAATIAVAVDAEVGGGSWAWASALPRRSRPGRWAAALPTLKGLVRRGLKGVRLVVPDAHEGLKHAIAKVLGAAWQRCRVHWMRNALAHVPKGQQTVVAAALRQAFLQADQDAARQVWRQVADQLRPRWPKLAGLMDESEHDVLAYTVFPVQHRTKPHATDPLERLNKEVKRRCHVKRRGSDVGAVGLSARP